MKATLLSIGLATLLGGFTTVATAADETDASAQQSLSSKKMLVRVTYYGPDAKWGNAISSTTKRRAAQGRTAAVDPAVIPYDSIIHLPGIGKLVAEDTGTDVKNRKASSGHGNIPVIDVYVGSEDEAEKLSREMPETMVVTILTGKQQSEEKTEQKSKVTERRLETVHPQPDMA